MLFQAFLLRRFDFDDRAVQPRFFPLARPGQQVEIEFSLERWAGQSIGVEGYVRDTFSQKDIITTSPAFPSGGERYRIAFAIPSLEGSFTDEVWLKLTVVFGKRQAGLRKALLSTVRDRRQGVYDIDISRAGH
jgi:hypothetical protein